MARALDVELAWIKALEAAVNERRSSEIDVPRHAMLHLVALLRDRYARLGILVQALRAEPLDAEAGPRRRA